MATHLGWLCLMWSRSSGSLHLFSIKFRYSVPKGPISATPDLKNVQNSLNLARECLAEECEERLSGLFLCQRGTPQPNTRFENEATEETESWTMSSDALFSLLSPVQNILLPKQHSTAWHCE
jgi:hypothetical protein